MNQDCPFVSVVMPAYNASKYIGQAIESVLNQTYVNFELIVIDDCSTDNTYDIIKKYSENDNRIEVVKNKINSGVTFTRNLGISLAKYDWIAFLDSDDIWVKDKLEKQIKLTQKIPEASLIFTGTSYINSEGKSYSYILKVPDKITYKELLKQNVISCSSVLVRKKCIENIKIPDGDIHEDFVAWLTILKKEKYAYGINEPLLIYRLSNNSKSGNKLKAIKMNYRVYKAVGLNVLECNYYSLFYILKNTLKYLRIYIQS